MIKFFRKIRYNLMETGKTSKYFKYAIGEIVLVVIGILIALSINNWNEKRKLLIDERIVLTGVLNDIKKDTIDLNFNRQGYKTLIEMDSIILEHLMNKKEQSELFTGYFEYVTSEDFILTLHSSSFDEAKQKGLTTEANNPIWTRINRLYNFYYPELIHFEHEYIRYKTNRNLFPIFNDFLELDSFNDGLVTINDKNYNQLLTNKKFHHKFYQTKLIFEETLSRYDAVYLELLEIIELIEKEITKG